MAAMDDYKEYLEEIRETVCSRCPERPDGGPPCGPLGKPCGVELHLPLLIEAVRGVHCNWPGPFVDYAQESICPKCPYQHDVYHCPCPMETLMALIVPAVEAVDERRRQRRRDWEHLMALWDD